MRKSFIAFVLIALLTAAGVSYAQTLPKAVVDSSWFRAQFNEITQYKNSPLVTYIGAFGQTNSINSFGVLGMSGVAGGIGGGFFSQTAQLPGFEHPNIGLWAIGANGLAGANIGLKVGSNILTTSGLIGRAIQVDSGDVFLGRSLTYGGPPNITYVNRLELDGTLEANTDPGTNGELLVSTGASTPPQWMTPPNALAITAWLLGGNNVVATSTIGTITNYDFPIITNNTEKMRVTTAGNVGIGTTTPSWPLDVAASGALTSAFTGARVTNTATTLISSINKIGLDVQSTGLWTGGGDTNTGLNVFVGDGATNYAALLNGGNVGIGTRVPTTLLQVGDVGTQGVLSLAGTTSGLVTITTQAAAGTWSLTLPTTGGTINYVLTTDGFGVTTWTNPTGFSVPINHLLLASGSNTIDNTNYDQNWQWSTLAGGNGLSLTAATTAATGSTQTLFNVGLSGVSANDAETTYGMQVANTHTNATSGTNVGALFSASGATTGNYAIVVPAGNVGIGTSTPSTLLQLGQSGTEGVLGLAGTTSGLLVSVQPDPSTTAWSLTLPATGGTNNYVLSTNGSGVTSWTDPTGIGVAISSLTNGLKINTLDAAGFAQTWTWNSLVAANALSLTSNSALSTGTTQTMLNIAQTGGTTATGVTTTGLKISNTHTNATSGTNIGASISASGATTANYALIVPAGNVGIGTSTPSTLLQLGQTGTEGVLGLAGSTSGSLVSVQPDVSTTAWSLTLPPTGGTNNYVLTTNGSGVTAWTDPSTIGVAISSLTNGVKINTLDAANFAQTWTWNSLSTQNALTLSSSSISSGNLLSLSTNSTAAASNAQTMLNVSMSGANATQTTTGIKVLNNHNGATSVNVGASFAATNGASNYAIIVPTSSGNVGIGNSAPATLLSIGTAGTLTGAMSIGGATGGSLIVTVPTAVSNWTMTLPTDVPAANNSVLTAATSGSGVTTWSTLASLGIPINNLLVATGTNDINNAAFNQTWRWNTIGTLKGLSLATSGLSSGSLLDLAATSTAVTGSVLDVSSSSISSGNLVKLSTNSTAAASNSQTMLNIVMTGSNATQTTYGMKISNGHIGGTSTNVGAWISATGGVTANYALVIPDASGSVGIGTVTPAFPLDILSGTGNPGSALDLLRLQNNQNVSVNNAAEIVFANPRTGGTMTNIAAVAGLITNTGAATYTGALQFKTSTSNAAPTEKVRIDNNGNVGINTTNPSVLLDVKGDIRLLSTAGPAASRQLMFQNPAATFASKFQAGAQTADLAYTWPITTPNANDILISSGTVASNLSWISAPTLLGGQFVQYNITTTQNGAALSAGNYLYDVSYAASAGSNNAMGARITSTSGTGASTDATGLTVNATANSGTATGLLVTVSGGATNYAGLFNGGNVGILTSTPTAPLHVLANGAKTAAYTGTKLYNTATSTTGSLTKIGTDVQSTGTWTGAGMVNTGLNVLVSDGTTNYAGLFNGGNVGIGTTTPSTPLDVLINNGGGTQNVIRAQNNIPAVVNAGAQLVFGDNRNVQGMTSVAAVAGLMTDIGELTYKGALVFSTAAYTTLTDTMKERMRIDYAGNVGIATASPGQKLDVAGNIRLLPVAGPTASQLMFNNPAGTKVSSFAAGAQAVDLIYTLPLAAPNANDVLVSGGGATNTLTWQSAGSLIVGNFVQYDVLATQATAAARTDYLFNVGYPALGSDLDAAGASITSTGGATNRNAKGLTVTSNATGSGTSTALTVSAAGGTTDYAAVFTAGNVGVLTSTPSAPLEVAAQGVQTVNYTGTKIGNTATTATTNLTKIALDIQSTGNWNVSGDVNTGLNVNVSGGTTNYAALFAGGNVGIGTSTPAQALDVKNGNILLSQSTSPGQLKFQGTLAGITSIKAGAQGTTDLTYTLPITTPAASDIMISGGGASSQLAWISANTLLNPLFVEYNITSTQNVAALTGTNYLYDVSYASSVTTNDAKGARITSTSGTAGASNATGLTIAANADGAGTSTGLKVDVSGGTTNYAALFNGGYVGVGTTAPTLPLDVLVSSGGGQVPAARLQNNAIAATNNGPQLVFAANRTTGGMTNMAAIAGVLTDIGNLTYQGELVFSTSNAAAPAERVRIDHNGNVGIGTNSPSTLLQLGQGGVAALPGILSLASSSSGLVTIQTVSPTTGTWTWTMPAAAGATGTVLTATDASGGTGWASPSSFGTKISSLLAATAGNTINNIDWPQEWDWNGQTSTSALTLFSNATTALTGQTLLNLNMQGTNTASAVTTYGMQVSNTHTGTSSVNIGGKFSASGGNANYGVIVPSGNVGIGTSTPTKLLEVKNGDVLLSNTGTASKLQFQTPTGGANVTTFSAVAQSANINYTLPPNNGAAAGYVLSNSDAAGTLTWAVPSATVIQNGVASPAAYTADQNDLVVVTSTATIYRITSTSASTITISGVQSSGVISGRQITFVNVSAAGNKISFSNQDVNSTTAADRFITNGTGSIETISPNDAITFWFDGTSSRWRMLNKNY